MLTPSDLAISSNYPKYEDILYTKLFIRLLLKAKTWGTTQKQQNDR